MISKAPTSRDWWHRVLALFDGPVTDRLLKLSVAVVMLGMLWLAGEQRALSQCQIRYADAVAQATKQRTQAAEEDRKALDTMVSAVTNATVPGSARTALLRYQDTRAAADRKRAENPIPEPPSSFCK